MTKSKSMWAVALLLGLWAAYFTYSSNAVWPYTIASIAAAVTAIGLLVERRWAAVLLYVLVAFFVGWVVVALHASGGPLLPYPDALSYVIAYTPLATILAVCAFLVIATYRHFHARRRA